MKILHISDIHYSSNYGNYRNGYKKMVAKMDNPLIHLKESLAHAKRNHEIDLLLISGDLTEDGSVEDYLFLRKWLEKEMPNVPIVVTLGNHDIKEHFYSGWLGEPDKIGPYNQVVPFEQCYVISFDSSVFGLSDGQVSEEQFNWLERALKTHHDKPIIVMTHHHLLEEQSSINPLPQSEKLLNMLNEYSVSCVLNGHTHHSFSKKINGLLYYTVCGMSFVGEDEGEGLVCFEQKHGYNMYEMHKGSIQRQTSEQFMTGRIIDRINMLNDNNLCD